MIIAAKNGHVRAVEMLIAAKAQVDFKTKVRFTACLLILGVYRMVGRHCTWPVRMVGVVRILLEAKAIALTSLM